VTIESMTGSGLPNNTPGEHAPTRRGALEPLAGTRVLVSGATSGLGRAMASALVEAGAEVIITGRQLARAQASAAGLGARAVGLELDVRDETSVRAGVERAWAHLGGVDVLVNNAGIGMRTVNPRFLTDPQPFWKVSPEGFRDVLDTKATGSFLLARELVPRMLDAGGGRVVNISMNEQTMIRRGFVPYGPSGAAVEALSRVMAADLAETSVRVNVLLPGGATATGMVPEDAPAEVRASLLDPAVMGPPIVWLASSDAKDVHDERIVASGFASWLASRTP
jgi:NAD(P)-dependent dehydrogenase (short-subunit alcohol dehydrogenase family)